MNSGMNSGQPAQNVLVINCGSSSLKYQLLDMRQECLLAKGLVERIGMEQAVHTYQRPDAKDLVTEQSIDTSAQLAKTVSPIRSTQIEMAGHLFDSGLINRLLDLANEAGGEASVEHLTVAQRHDQPSTARLRLTAPSAERLDLIVNRLMPLGARPTAEPTDARLQSVTQSGVAPDDFYSTTIYPKKPKTLRMNFKYKNDFHFLFDFGIVDTVNSVTFKTMIKYLTIILAFLFICSAVCAFGYYKGRQSAFSDIILEKCTLNKTTRDIECIIQVED